MIRKLSRILRSKPLIIGVGNSGRRDDGLGWEFLDMLEEMEEVQAKLEYRYQLQVEDAFQASQHNLVLFVDASQNSTPSGYDLSTCYPANDLTFTTHALTPQAVLHLCRHLYGCLPESYVLQIEGYEWELKKGLSIKAKQNLDRLSELIHSGIYNSFELDEVSEEKVYL